MAYKGLWNCKISERCGEYPKTSHPLLWYLVHWARGSNVYLLQLAKNKEKWQCVYGGGDSYQ